MDDTRPYPTGESAVKWVTTEWLENHLEDGKLMILDAQPDMHDYFLQHIPGARYVNPRMFVLPVNSSPDMYIPGAAVKAIFDYLGIKNDVPVVVYSGNGAFSMCGDQMEQAMMAYTLIRFGHSSVYILDGGLEKWNEEERPLSQEFPEVITSDFWPNVHREWLVTMEEIKSLMDEPNTVLLDSRPKMAYEEQALWIKPGHIPGAVSLPWNKFMTEANPKKLRPVGDIHALLKEEGLKPDMNIIISCGSGTKAALQFIVFKYLLKWPKVRIYEGSFTEWSACEDNLTVTGPNPGGAE
jgi:thiosulfate/3-mercaptopyruvate sulfurtransferase